MEAGNPANVDVIADLFNSDKVLMLIMAGIFLWVVNVAVSRFSAKLMDKLPARRFLLMQTTTLFSFIWYIGGVYWMIAVLLNPPKEMLLGLGGSFAVAVGIALKDVTASLIAGLILLFDRPFQVGDRVSFDGVYGDIVSIGLRTVRLNTLDDNLVAIPNSRFITDVVASGNAGALDMMMVCDFHVALNTDLKKAKALIHEVVVTSRFAYLKKKVSFVFCEVVIADRLAIKISAKAYVLDVKYEKAFQSDVVERVSQLFVEHQIPRPNRDSLLLSR